LYCGGTVEQSAPCDGSPTEGDYKHLDATHTSYFDGPLLKTQGQIYIIMSNSFIYKNIEIGVLLFE